MYGSSAAGVDFRSQRICFSISGSLLLMLLLLVAQCLCRPPDELHENFAIGDEYGDVDNVEWHHVKIVNGVMRESHPIIMYKEDFVSEDYDPDKNHSAETSNTANRPTHPKRKYKDISHHRRRLQHNETEQYRALKPEKKYFDVLPPTPIVATEDLSASSDYKFDPSKIRVEVISLVEQNKDLEYEEEQEAENGLKNKVIERENSSKQLLSKRPKKYHKRSRRNAPVALSPATRTKRNPYLRHHAANTPEVSNFLQQFYELMRTHTAQNQKQPQAFTKHNVPGKLWNALSLPVEMPTTRPNPEGFGDRFGGPDESDRVVWGGGSNRRTTTTRPNTSRLPSVTRRPAPPLFHDSRPQNADTSFLNEPVRQSAPVTTSAPSAELPSPEATEAAISQCVWAIVNCCSANDAKVRYNCFEALGCRGSFWDLNPCADSIRDNVINFVGDYYD